jgi:hypothetical protein
VALEATNSVTRLPNQTAEKKGKIVPVLNEAPGMKTYGEVKIYVHHS